MQSASEADAQEKLAEKIYLKIVTNIIENAAMDDAATFSVEELDERFHLKLLSAVSRRMASFFYTREEEPKKAEAQVMQELRDSEDPPEVMGKLPPTGASGA
jgi:hypothetical protein